MISKKKKKESLNQRAFFTLYLGKAGIDMPLIDLRRRLFYISIVIAALGFIYLTADSVMKGLFSIKYFLILIVAFPAIAALAASAIVILFVVYIDVRIYQRRVNIEEVLPDFLQLASANVRSGMTIDRALWSAIRPQFGVLAKEMEMVAKQTMSGEDLDKALMEFSKKYDSPTLVRTVNLLVEGLRAGGEIGDLLERISLNLHKSQTMQMEMAANVTSYVMFISFATVVAAPVLYGLSLQIIDITTSIIGGLDLGSGGGSMPMSIGKGASIARSDFITFALMSITVTSFFSACIISMIKKGNIKSGIKTIPIFIGISIAIFYISSWMLGKMFAGIF